MLSAPDSVYSPPPVTVAPLALGPPEALGVGLVLGVVEMPGEAGGAAAAAGRRDGVGAAAGVPVPGVTASSSSHVPFCVTTPEASWP